MFASLCCIHDQQTRNIVIDFDWSRNLIHFTIFKPYLVQYTNETLMIIICDSHKGWQGMVCCWGRSLVKIVSIILLMISPFLLQSKFVIAPYLHFWIWGASFYPWSLFQIMSLSVESPLHFLQHNGIWLWLKNSLGWFHNLSGMKCFIPCIIQDFFSSSYSKVVYS